MAEDEDVGSCCLGFGVPMTVTLFSLVLMSLDLHLHPAKSMRHAMRMAVISAVRQVVLLVFMSLVVSGRGFLPI